MDQGSETHSDINIPTALSANYPALRKLSSLVKNILDTIKDQVKGEINSSDPESSKSIQILACLEELQAQICESRSSTMKEDVDPLGLRDRKAVTQAIDLLIIFEIQPQLAPGIGVPISQRIKSDVVSFLSQMQSLPQWKPAQNMNLGQWLKRLVGIVDSSIGLTDVGSIIANKYVSDLLAGLLQVAYSPIPQTKAQKLNTQTMYYIETDNDARIELRKCFTRLYNNTEPYLLLESLSTLLSTAIGTRPKPGPKWFRILCGRFLSRVMLRTDGVRITIDYMVNGDDELTAEKMSRVSNLLLSAPSNTPEDEYFSRVLPQLLKLSVTSKSDETQNALKDRDSSHNAANEMINAALDDKNKRKRVSQMASFALRHAVSQKRTAFHKWITLPVVEPIKRWNSSRANPKSKATITTLGGDKMDKKPLIQVIGESDNENNNSVKDKCDTLSMSQSTDAVLSSSETLDLSLSQIGELVLNDIPSEELILELVVPIFVPLFYWYSQVNGDVSESASVQEDRRLLSDIIIASLRFSQTSEAVSRVLKLIKYTRNRNDGLEENEQNLDRPVFSLNTVTKKTELIWKNSQETEASDNVAMGALMEILGAESLREVVGDVFIGVIREQAALLELVRERGDDISPEILRPWWLVSQVALEMVDRFGPAVLTQHMHILSFILDTLEKAQDTITSIGDTNIQAQNNISIEELIKSLDVGSDSNPTSSTSNVDIESEIEHRVGETEIIILALMILNQILLSSEMYAMSADKKDAMSDTTSIPRIKWDSQSLKLLRKILVYVQGLSSQKKLPVISKLANETKLQVMMVLAMNAEDAGLSTGSYMSGAQGTTDEISKEVARFNSALRDINDDLIPVKAHGVVELRNMVLSKSPILKDRGRLDVVVTVFLELIQSDDSFIYLNAIKGLSTLTDSHGLKFLPELVSLYTAQTSTLDQRLRIGEALLQTVLRAGDALGKYAPLIVPSLIATIDQHGTDASTQDNINDENEGQDKDRIIMAHSAISILSSMAQTSPLALHQWVSVLNSWFCDLIILDVPVVLRRAAVMFWVSLLRGYGNKLLGRIEPDVLQSLYKSMRRLEDSDPDELVRLHAQAGLGELNDAMHNQLFSAPNYL